MLQQNMIGIPVADRQAFVGIPTLNFTATGSTQGTAALLPSDFVVCTTVPASSGVILPFGYDGTTAGPVNIADQVQVTNYGANALSVYPQSGGKIQNGTANAAITINAGKSATFYYVGGGNWSGDISS